MQPIKRRACSICGQRGHKARRTPTGMVCPYQGQRAGVREQITLGNATDAIKGNCVEFPLLADLLDETHKAPIFGCDENTAPKDFNGHVTLAQARDMLAGTGAPELAEQVRAIMVDMVPAALESNAVGAAWGVSGAIVDVERYLSGDPECMLDMFNPAGTQRTMEVWVSTAVTAAFEASAIIERGAAICAMVDAIERAGIRVQLHWCNGVRMLSGEVFSCHGLLKDYHAALDLDLVAFVLAHPAFQRRLMFKVRDRAEVCARDAAGGGYGSSCPFTAPEGAVYIQEMSNPLASYWAAPKLATVQAAFEKGMEHAHA